MACCKEVWVDISKYISEYRSNLLYIVIQLELKIEI